MRQIMGLAADGVEVRAYRAAVSKNPNCLA